MFDTHGNYCLSEGMVPVLRGMTWKVLFYLLDNPCIGPADIEVIDRYDTYRQDIGIPSIWD